MRGLRRLQTVGLDPGGGGVEAHGEAADHLVDLLIRDDQGRREGEGVAGRARAGDQAPFEQALGGELLDPVIGIELPPGRFVGDDLNPRHEPDAAHVADQRVVGQRT